MDENQNNGEDTTIYKVIIEVDEETNYIDFSIWPAERPNPPGWMDGKIRGTKMECAKYATEARLDTTPLKVRKARGDF